jgi:hypothetical protein
VISYPVSPLPHLDNDETTFTAPELLLTQMKIEPVAA